MRLRRKRLVLAMGAALACLVTAGVLLALWGLHGRGDAVTPMQVPRSFAMVRDSAGHAAHLGSHQVACRDCHALASGSFDRPPAEICARCHQQELTSLHDSVLARASIDCLSCHDFAGDPRIQPWACSRCHATAQGYAQAIEVHGQAPCGGCHRAHDRQALEPRPCTDAGCHGERTLQHGQRAGSATQCLDCHQVHDTHVAANDRCAGCHRQNQPYVPPSATFSGHPTCTGCHEPHEFSRTGVRPCTGCHQQLPVLASARSSAHARCDSCHQPHDPRAAVAAGDASCARCHAKVHGWPPGDTSGTSAASELAEHPLAGRRGHHCLGCHPIHGSSPSSSSPSSSSPSSSPSGLDLANMAAVPCSTCHAEAASDTALHAGHLACTRCHAPHVGSPAETVVASCASCHRDQAAARSAHEACTSCHRTAAHAPAVPPMACGTCHIAQRLTAPAGHWTCTDCHDAHATERGRERPCASCHEAAARSIHGRVPDGCAACHRAHGPGLPQMPVCTSCHPVAALPALHGHAKHQTCADCHTAHQLAPSGARATCMRCHSDLVDHEPAAAVCTGCHLFTRSSTKSAPSHP